MAVMQALLKIRAMVTGEEGLTSLAKGMGALKKGAGELSGALGSLVPLVSGIGLAALGRELFMVGDESQRASVRISALAKAYDEVDGVTDVAARAAQEFALGNVDAKNAVTDLYGRLRPMNVSLKDIETVFFGVNKAAKQVGLSSYETSEVLLQLSQALGSGKLQGDELRSIMERMPAVGQAVAKVMGVSASEIKKLGSEGKITTEVMIRAAAELNKIVPPPPTALQNFDKALKDLRTEFGENLLPLMLPFVQALTGLAKGFASLPEPIQTTTLIAIAAVGGLVIALGPLVQVINGVIMAGRILMALKLGATIAGWAGAIGPAMGVISAAFTGLLAFLSGTVLPALLAFFSGPVGWTVLAVAAVVAMAIAFREPLGKFITWLGSVFKKGWDGFVNNILKKPIQNYFKWWRSNWEKAAGFVTGVFGKVKGAVVTVFGAVTGVVRTIIAGAFRFGAELFNNWIAALNNILKGLKQIPFLGLRLLPLLTPIKVPAFAQGGLVTRPTIAMVGEGGQNEFILPESRLKDFAQYNAELSWQKLLNSAWLRSLQPSTGSDIARESFKRLEQQITNLGLTGSAPNKNLLVGNEPKQLAIHQTNTFDVEPIIQITTGPVIQFDNQRFVTLDEFEAGLRTAVRSVFDSLRNPATRIQLGLS
jgi:tape measure domain-containing protein